MAAIRAAVAVVRVESMPSAARRMLLVHAHPDDETLWTGGVIARYATEGVDVALLAQRAGDQRDLHAVGGVPRDRTTGQERLVVRVRVHEQHPTLRHAAKPTTVTAG